MSPHIIRTAGTTVDLAEVEQSVLSARKSGKLLGCRLILAQGLDAEVFAELAAFLSGAGAAGLHALDLLRQLPDQQVQARLAALTPDPDAAAGEL